MGGPAGAGAGYLLGQVALGLGDPLTTKQSRLILTS
jgi:hypothetical protein